jgi:3-oxoacyl-[acyl-carrier-protein] synthase II
MKKIISGYGVISAVGKNSNESLTNFKKGIRSAKPVSIFKTSLDYPVFEVENLTYIKEFSNQRTIALLFNAAYEALKSANLENNTTSHRIGVCLGTTVACQLNDIKFYRTIKEKQKVDMKPVNSFLKGNLADALSKALKLNGPSLTVANACSSGADAIGIAAQWINNDLCDIVITGGADELNLVPLTGFGALGILSHELCSPFDKNRSGLNLGEGAGIVILESQKHAEKRGHTSDILFTNYSSAADAYHLTAPSPEGKGLRKAILSVMSNSNVKPEDISFINAHGTSTRDNDCTEAKVFLEIFGPGLLFLSTKGYTGHTLGAAGGIEAVFTIMALKENWIPKSIGFKDEDEEIIISPVTSVTELNKKFGISTSLAFGGNNSVLLFEKIS